jgi:NitT/TauT family transport system substrate-binding protein
MLAILLRPARLAMPVVLAAMSIAIAQQAWPCELVLKVDAEAHSWHLRLFYEKFVPAGYAVEVYPFESPTDGKNAVLTGTVDTCIHGIAAFLLGAPPPASRSRSSPMPTTAGWR